MKKPHRRFAGAIGRISFALLFGIVSSSATVAFTLPDTGQTSCYDNEKEIVCPAIGQPFYGQDGNYQGPQPTYLDNGNGTVTDLNTGLTWQQGDSHNIPGQNCAIYGCYTWQQAMDYCPNLDLAGSGWRLPSMRELVSIIDFSRHNPSIDTRYFEIARDSYHMYWSNSIPTDNPDYPRQVYFDTGTVGSYNPKGGLAWVRCVQGNPLPGGPYVDNLDSTVTDQSTGLMWQQTNDVLQGGSWNDALTHCNELVLGGHHDWRLPNIRDLFSIVNENSIPALDPVFSHSGNIWSATTAPGSPNWAQANWVEGGVSAMVGAKDNYYYWMSVACVRNGQITPPLPSVTAPLHDEDGLVMTTSDYSNFAAREYFDALKINHSGLDLALSSDGTHTASISTAGKPVYPICEGEVEFAHRNGGLYSFVKVRHSDCGGQEVVAYYGHISPKKGITTVMPDDPIGTVKNWNGNSHLHLTIDTDTQRDLSHINYITCNYSLDKNSNVTNLTSCSTGQKLTNGKMLLKIGWGQIKTVRYKTDQGKLYTKNLYITESAIRQLGFISFFDIYQDTE